MPWIEQLCNDDDGIGPLNRDHDDITPCFQSIILSIFPSIILMFLMATIHIYKLRGVPSPPLDVPKVYHRTRLVASFALVLFPLAALISHVSSPPVRVYFVVDKIITVIAWSVSIMITIMEDRRLLLSSWITRSFWIIQWIKIDKTLESVILDIATGDAKFNVDTLIIIFQLIFDTIMAINGIRPARNEYTNLTPFAAVDQDDGIDNAASADGAMDGNKDDGTITVVTQGAPPPRRRGSSVWNRFLTKKDENGSLNDGTSSSSSSSSSNRPSSRTPYALMRDGNNTGMTASTVSGSSGGMGKRNDSSDNLRDLARVGKVNLVGTNGSGAPTSSSSSSNIPYGGSSMAIYENKVGLVLNYRTGELSPIVAIESILVPNWLEGQVSGGKTQVQFVLSVKLRLRPSDDEIEADPAGSVEESADTFTLPRRARDFQGLNENLSEIARRHKLRPLPSLPPRDGGGRTLEQQRATIESYLQFILREPLYADDLAQFLALGDRMKYIKSNRVAAMSASAVSMLSSSPSSLGAGTSLHSTLAGSPLSDSLRSSNSGLLGTSSRSRKDRDSSFRRSTSTLPQVVGRLPWRVQGVHCTGWSIASEDGASLVSPLSMPPPPRGATSDGTPPDSPVMAPVTTGAGVPSLSLPATSVGHLNSGTAVVSSSSGLASSATMTSGSERSWESRAPITFQISVRTNKGAWVIHKRWAEMKELNAVLNKRFLTEAVPELTMPPTWDRSEHNLQEARKNIEGFLQDLVHQPTFHCDELAEFLDKSRRRGQTIKEQADVASSALASVAATASPGLLTSPSFSISAAAASASTAGGGLSMSGGGGERKTSGGGTSGGSSSDDYHRFETTIPSWSYTEEGNASSPVVYLIVVREYYQQYSFIEWKIYRRYSDFEELHEKLTKLFKHLELPSLPGKGFNVGRASKEFLDGRLKALLAYLQRIVYTRTFQVDELHSFLGMNGQRAISYGTETPASAAAAAAAAAASTSSNGTSSLDDSDHDDITSPSMSGKGTTFVA